jgi:hypothetical protein
MAVALFYEYRADTMDTILSGLRIDPLQTQAIVAGHSNFQKSNCSRPGFRRKAPQRQIALTVNTFHESMGFPSAAESSRRIHVVG